MEAQPGSSTSSTAATRAAVLAEALPFIREFWGTTVVVKLGGNAMEDPELRDLLAQDVVLMRLVGMNPVLVHGGGPQISSLMRRLGKEPLFVDGLRVTDAETVDIVRMALVGKVNRELVGSLNRHGPYAVGLSGEDAGLFLVRQRDPALGFVGDVERVNATILERLLGQELIPVIASVGVDASGQAYNVNADAAASAIAQALSARKLVYVTNVAGLHGDLSDPATLLSEVDLSTLEVMIGSGSLTGGMLPKARSCLEAMSGGVERAHLLDGRVPHALLLEFFTREGIGTMVVP
ncbi:MAG: acetylglutamate kinase [Acidimicrobiia bacterium]